MTNNTLCKFCNMCGKECEDDFNDILGLHILVTGGYNSTPGVGNGALDDCTEYKCTICEFCLDHIFQSFQIPVSVKDYIHSEYIDFVPALERVLNSNGSNKAKFISDYYNRSRGRNGHLLLEKLNLIKKIPGMFFRPGATTEDLFTFLLGWDLANGTRWGQELESHFRKHKIVASFKESLDIAISMVQNVSDISSQ